MATLHYKGYRIELEAFPTPGGWSVRGQLWDFETGVDSLKARAAQGEATAQFNLGLRYYTGRGVPQDAVEAYMWFDLVAATAPNPDRRKLAGEARDYVAARMTPAQIAEAQKRAREWKKK